MTIAKEPIAVVGMGCRFPGEINSTTDFWKFLLEGKDAISEVPEDRWNNAIHFDANPNKAGKIKASKGGFVKNADHFDAEFFDKFPAEAERIDPQQRFLLEVTYEAFEDAGIRLEDVSGSSTSVYMGVFMNDYWDIQASALQKDEISPHVAMGVSLTAIANRISYVYNLKGPSMTIDTACSSSLVCVHQACQSLWLGESSLAVAGGVNLMLRPESSIMMSKGNFLSPDGHCKAFDSKANGYVRSEGCGIIVLKPLSKALADGDKIYSVIKGTAVNQDGHTEEGFTVPSVEAQSEMLKKAYEMARIDPADVHYVEAHGTGTPVGDPRETNAFGNVFGQNRSEDKKLIIGSVKTNIGHLEAAAGIAGLIKLALILKNRQIPKNLHFHHPNPKIPFDQYKIKVASSLEDIPENISPVTGGVNSFGAGGTNAHVVMQEFVPQASLSNGQLSNGHHQIEKVELLALSGKTEQALKANAGAFMDYLKNDATPLHKICQTAVFRRSAFPHRLTVAGRNKSDMIDSLEAYLQEETRPGMSAELATKQKRKLGFIFSGQGPQWFAMGRELIAKSPVFKETILKIESHFAELADWSLLEELSRDEATTKISDTRIAQPAIMAIQIALVELWKSWGITPEGTVGHSIGEVAAAYTAGALTLEQAVQVIYHRSRGQNKATGKGKMLAVALTAREARQAIRGMEEKVSIAAINGPNMIALSGDVDALEKVEQEMARKEIFHRYLKVTVPFHCHHMEPLKDELIESLQELQSSRAELPLYSTVTGKLEDGLHLDSNYWYSNVRETVYFTDALQSMINDGFDTFVEIAPHPVLAVGANDLLAQNNVKNALIVPSLRRKEDEEITMVNSLGMLHTHGYSINWQNFMGKPADFVQLPRYQWQHQKYWYENEASRVSRLGSEFNHPFLKDFKQSANESSRFIWDLNINKASHPYLEGHKVDGSVVFPATAHLEVAQAIAQISFKDQPIFLQNIKLDSALFLPEDGHVAARLEVTSDEGEYTIYSKSEGDSEQAWSKHVTGRINYLGDKFNSISVDLQHLKNTITDAVSVPDFYVSLKEDGLNYGDTFRCLHKLFKNDQMEVLSAVSLSNSETEDAHKYLVHPALLDACLHSIFAAKQVNREEKRGIYLPVGVESYKVHRPAGSQVWCYIRVSEASNEFLRGDYWLMNEDGVLLAEMKGLQCKYLEGSRGEQKDDTYQGMFEYQWQSAEQQDKNPLISFSETVYDANVLLFGTENDLSSMVSDKLKKEGANVIQIKKGTELNHHNDRNFTIEANNNAHLQNVIKYIHSLGLKIDQILYLWSTDMEMGQDMNASTLQAQQRDLANPMINILKVLVQQDKLPVINIVCKAAEKVLDNDSELNLSQAPLYGMARVMSNEYPLAPLRIIDLPGQVQIDDVRLLVNELARPFNKQRITEMAIREGKLFIRKLIPAEKTSDEQQLLKKVPAARTPFKANINAYGAMDSIDFRFAERSEPGFGEVEIEVKAAGLNFKDVLNVMGLLSDEAVAGGIAGKNLGLECSGIITKVGEGIARWKVGDEVVAWSSESYAGYTIAKAHCVAPKPQHYAFTEAAGITVVYLTAYYGLNYLARMSAGDTVLVHSATGGVGLAAIQLARIAGAQVIATAGNQEKREYLRSIGIEHVFDSRSLTFADQVMKVTDGRGVDIVINSLSGKAINQSIRCLAPFGHFVEIGKADIYANAKIGLKKMGENLSFHVVDLDRLMKQKPKLAEMLYHDLTSLLSQHKVQAHPVKAFPVSELNHALQYLSKAQHIGKVVVEMEGSEIELLPANSLTLKSDATYLITGGASGFGLTLANWMVEKGARHMALLSRSGCKTPQDFALVEKLKSRGIQVELVNVDITDQAAIAGVVDQIAANMPQLRGIIHGAAVLDDATIPTVDIDRYMKVFNPKVMGAWNLHQATLDLPLDFFTMLSSISSAFGIPGQIAYSSANNFLDKLAHFRQSKGLAGTSVNLGLLGDYAGMTKDGGHMINVLANQGWLQLTYQQITDKLEQLLIINPAQRTAANIDWRRFKDFFLHLNHDVRYAEVLQQYAVQNQAGGANSGLVEQLLQAGEEKNQLLQDKFAEALAKILGTAADKIDQEVPITKIGLDSLMLNQLRNWIQQKLELNYPLMKIAKGPSIAELSGDVLDQILGASATDTEALDTSGISSDKDIEVLDGWLVRNSKNTQEIKKRIFCFHPVGAGASMFSHFIYNPPVETDILAFQLPGRENRQDETFYEDIHELVRDMAEVIKPYLDVPFAFYGHSFGGIIAYELIRYLRKHEGLQPFQLFISGTIAPHLTRKWKERDVIHKTAISSTSDEKLLSLMTYIDDVDFLKQILPVMKKDMPLIMSYPYEEEEIFNFPITAFAADKDEVVYLHEIEQWSQQTTDQFYLEVMEGDHWFLSRNKEQILQRVSDNLDLMVV